MMWSRRWAVVAPRMPRKSGHTQMGMITVKGTQVCISLVLSLDVDAAVSRRVDVDACRKFIRFFFAIFLHESKIGDFLGSGTCAPATKAARYPDAPVRRQLRGHRGPSVKASITEMKNQDSERAIGRTVVTNNSISDYAPVSHKCLTNMSDSEPNRVVSRAKISVNFQLKLSFQNPPWMKLKHISSTLSLVYI